MNFLTSMAGCLKTGATAPMILFLEILCFVPQRNSGCIKTDWHDAWWYFVSAFEIKRTHFLFEDACQYQDICINMAWFVNNWNFETNNLYSANDSNSNELSWNCLPLVQTTVWEHLLINSWHGNFFGIDHHPFGRVIHRLDYPPQWPLRQSFCNLVSGNKSVKRTYTNETVELPAGQLSGHDAHETSLLCRY